MRGQVLAGGDGVRARGAFCADAASVPALGPADAGGSRWGR